ncbi:MAG TPA: hypothetical protein VGK94_09720 [Candidatus Polarisedimenticolia bacterium]
MRALVVTIDTEEEGRWSSEYPAMGNTCRNVERLDRIHRIFTKLGVVPTYLVDYPVATDPRAREIIAGFAAGGASEIGAHLHPWCNPPFGADGTPQNTYTYPHNLPRETQRMKLDHLCRAIEEGIGIKPVSYRAGRWGFGHSTVPVLEELGIQVDTSVTPLWWDTSEGGPVFAKAPLTPYRLNSSDACRPGGSSVVEVPTSSLVVGGHGRAIERMVRMVGPAPGLRRWLVRMGLRSLRPEKFTFDEMKGLSDAIAARGMRIFNLTFHSSVALPGATPFVVDEEQLDAFCGRLEAILEHILARHQATPIPLARVPAFLGDAILRGQG